MRSKLRSLTGIILMLVSGIGLMIMGGNFMTTLRSDNDLFPFPEAIVAEERRRFFYGIVICAPIFVAGIALMRKRNASGPNEHPEASGHS